MEIFDDGQLCGCKTAIVSINLNETGRYDCKVLAQYTRQTLNNLQIGDLVAAENFKTCGLGSKCFSILSISSLLPSHFAMQDEKSYPGHLFESTRSIANEWKTQESRPKYSTTTIEISCIPTGMQFEYDKTTNVEDVEFKEDETLPMLGSEIRPFTKDMIEKIVNRDVPSKNSPLSHKRLENLRISLEKTALVTTHMGIFGFTNSGKSNLTSSLVSYLIKNDKVNLVIVDPNDEYIGLLSDLIMKEPDKFLYVHTDFDSLPKPILSSLSDSLLSNEKLKSDEKNIEIGEREKKMLISQLKLPKGLKNDSHFLSALTGKMNILAGRIRLGIVVESTVDLFNGFIEERTPYNFAKDNQDAIEYIIGEMKRNEKDVEIRKENIDKLLETIEIPGKYKTTFFGKLDNTSNKSKTAKAVFLGAIEDLRKYGETIKDLHKEIFIKFSEINDFLNDKESAGKIVIMSGRRDASLKNFSTKLGDGIYESRRREGNLSPHVFFLLDEADLFIPNDGKDEKTDAMKKMCVTIARRGRKFGIGLGIATQRASLLDTQIMGNLHTYFISKLPRKYDREKVAEAFGIGEEQLNQIFSFKPGNWLLISHDATGITSVPIPVYADNADDRVLNFFNGKDKELEGAMNKNE